MKTNFQSLETNAQKFTPISITSKEYLTRFITEEPLIETKPSLAGISNISEVSALYFGIGLCNGIPKLSAGLPVDVLSMVLSAEQIDVPKYILIADTHAITNKFNAQSVDQLARQYQETLQRVVENLGFASWHIVKASQIDKTSTYRDIHKIIEATHDYIRRELADMFWFNHECNVNLKIGWALNGSKNSDEISFDEEFQRQFANPLGFIYVIPGRTFDPKKLRSAPYFCTNPNERILFAADENVAKKIISAQEQYGQQSTKPYENFLKQVIRLYNKTVEQIERGTLSERLQQIIERCTK